jgi:hypothetical protein
MNATLAPVSRQLAPPQPEIPPVSRSRPPVNATRKTIKQVIVYDDLDAGQGALQAAAGLIGELDAEADAKPVFWHFKLMEYPAWRIWATADALNSDMLILATQSESGLPGGVARWLKDCLAQKRGSDSAVIALFGPPGRYDGPDSPRLQFVRQVAEGAGLNFFAPGIHAGRAFDIMTVNLHAREETITPTLAGILRRTDCPTG